MQRCEDNKESESKLLWYVGRKEVEETGHRNCQFIDPHNVLDLIEGRRRPLVIISADESSILTDNPRGEMWTLFAVLRRAFREILVPFVNGKVWSIFSRETLALEPFDADRKPRTSFSASNLRDRFWRHCTPCQWKYCLFTLNCEDRLDMSSWSSVVCLLWIFYCKQLTFHFH